MHGSHSLTGGPGRFAALAVRLGLLLASLHAGCQTASAVTPPAVVTAGDVTISDGPPLVATTASPHWLSESSQQSPGLAQPASMTPGALPYPTTSARPLPHLLSQPQYVTASQPASSTKQGAVIVSDQSNPRTAAAPPALSTPVAPPKLINPPPAASAPVAQAPVKKRSGFWELILGPSPASTTINDPFAARTNGSTNTGTANATPPRTATAAAPAPATATNGLAGGSLWNQLLGTNPPAPELKAAASRPAATPALVSQLVPASAQTEVADEVITMELPAGPRPTLSDIAATKTPATSMTIGKPGSPAYQDAPVQSSMSAAPQPAGSLPVPTIPTQAYASATSALWQPFVMTNDAPSAAMPVMVSAPTAVAESRDERPESERVPSLLRPWYATNPQPASNGSSATSVAAAAPQSIPEAVAQSSLGRQLSMTHTEDLRTPMQASIDAQVKQKQEPWDGRVTVQWPLMSNPFTMTNTPPAPAYAAAGANGAQQVAYMQEALPDPTGNGSANDPAGEPGDDDESEGGAGKKKDERDTLVGARSIGTAPEDTSLDFLRTQTVLLQPGKHQFDIGIEYLITENDFPILLTNSMGDVIGVDNVEFKGRELTMPMELRYGLLRRLQGFVQVPVGWSNVQAAINNYDEYESDGGIGDIGFGLTAQLRDAYKDCPYIIGTVAGLAPTGGDPFGVLGTITPNAPSLGNGFWAISGNLLWVQTRYDPVVVFYGFGARYQFEHEYFGIEFEPGVEANYTLGTGFAVNERVTLSAQFFGAYVDDLKADGERVEGSNQEPMNLRLAATLAKPCNRLVEPFITFGLTDDSISSNFGITWTY